ncbi:MAG: hypothetical protein EAS52_08045 [Parapedobacter sp.]|nr:MAG: hypothetical protein EAS52_08045 [Parapedobacter sp.]
MENKKGLLIVFIIGAIVIGAALFKQFDFQNFKLEKPALAVVYVIAFVFCISATVKNLKNN